MLSESTCVSLEFEDLFLPLDLLCLGNLLSTMLFLVCFIFVFLSTCLLHYKLHCLDSQSHSRVHLYLDGVQVVVNELTESNKLTQWIINAFLTRVVRYQPIQARFSAQLQSKIGDDTADILFHVINAARFGNSLVPFL
mgnify:CR=1 FL=1